VLYAITNGRNQNNNRKSWRNFTFKNKTTYLILLIIYNWQIILYLLFKNQQIDIKIKYVVDNYHDNYWKGILIPIIMAFIYTLFFPILQVLINILFSWFKKADKNLNRREELEDAIHKFELQQNLTGQQSLERLQANIDLLTSENQKLINDNKNLLDRLKDENLKDEQANNFRKTISQKRQKEFDIYSKNILSKFQEFTTEEKSVFLDLINYFDEKSKHLSNSSIDTISLYADYADVPLDVLQENNILTQRYSNGLLGYQPTNIGFDILEYFKDNFKENL
jgi:regulator of replication initiation timing